MNLDRPLKIGITCYPTYGGSGAIATELGLRLAERGHEIHFITYAQPFRLTGFHERVYLHEVEMDGYPLFEHPPYTLALAVAIHNTALREGLDLVHVHYAIPHATSAWIAGEMLESEDGPPVITTLHGTDVTLVGLHPSFHAITRFSILKSRGITAVSDSLKEATVDGFQVPKERIQVIPNFVDTDLFCPDREPCHRRALAPEGQKIIMHISNFRPVKRVVDVVEIFAKMHAEVPSRLVMVGDGPERPHAAERARALGVDDDVVFLGKHSSVEELLSCADLFLLPSDSESFGLAALEAISCGTPVIGYAAGGLPEVIPDGVAGFLVPVGEIGQAANAGLRLLTDEALWEQFSRAGREVALSKFSMDLVIPKYEQYYRSLLAEEGS